MYLDALGLISDAQAVTASAVSTSSIDLGAVTPKRQIGTGEPMGFAVSVDVAADHTTGDETYEVDVIQSATADLATPDFLSKTVLTAAQLAAGAKFFFPIPPGFPTKQFIGLKYVTGGTTPTVTATAWLTAQSLFSVLAQPYAKNYAV